MKALYLTYDGLTDSLGQSQVLPYLVGLSENNIDITVISFEKTMAYDKQKELIKQITDSNNINWKPLKYTKKPPFVGTVYDILKLKNAVSIENKNHHISVIHCRSYISALVGLWAKRKYNIPFIFDMRGFWADERIDGKIWDMNNWIHKKAYQYFKKKEREFLQESATIISLTQSGKKEMLTWGIEGLNPDKIVVIPCAADYDLFKLVDAEKKNNTKIMLGINPNQFVLGYIGSLGTWYLTDEMLLFFSVLKQKFSNAKFLFITPDDEELIYKLGKKHELFPNDFIIQFSQRKNIPEIASAFDFSIFFIKPSYSKISSSPTKMGELLAMGIPLICNSNVGDVEEISFITKAGFCIDNLNVTKFKEIVKKLNEWNESSPKSRRETSKQFYNLKNGIKSYLSVYSQLLIDK